MKKKANNSRAALSKAFGWAGMVLVLGSFLGMVFGQISYGWFWGAIVVSAFIAFVVCPRLRGESSSFLEWLQPKDRKPL